MMMKSSDRVYQSYLLRLWLVEQNGIWVWRASLEEVSSGHKHAFLDLDALCQYLKGQTAVIDKKEQSK